MQKLGGKFSPTEIGLVVTDLLVENFHDIFDVLTPRVWKKNSTRSKKARRLDRRARRLLQEVREGSQIRREAHGKHQAYGEADGREMRALWLAAGDQVGQARVVLRVQFLRQGRSESCTFTKENPINLPDLDSADVQETTQKSIARTAAG